MRLGVVFPQTESGTDPAAIREYAQAIEAIGYEHLLAYDHVLGADPNRPGGWTGGYTHESLFHEPLVLFGFLAGVTERIELVTGVLILGQRQTALVAKQAAEVDVLSGGRLRLGVGIGWNAVEYEALGEDFHNRGRRSEEQVAVLRRLWAEPVVTFEGEFHHIAQAGLNPLPLRRTIPIWLGGSADAVLERAGRLADGWFPLLRDPQRVAEDIAKVRQAAERAGRDPAALGFEATARAADGIEAAVEQARAMEEAGATHLNLNTMSAGYRTLEEHADAAQLFLERSRGA
jgi:probable F420-dependent oxidoreductase